MRSPEQSAAIFSEVGQLRGVARALPVSSGWVASLIRDDVHFIEQQQGHVELYNWTDDPEELHDMSSAPEWRLAVEDFRQQVKTAMSRPPPPADGGQPSVDGEPERR
jgi:hypothetical protein